MRGMPGRCDVDVSTLCCTSEDDSNHSASKRESADKTPETQSPRSPKPSCRPLKGLKERPLKGPLGLYRGCMRPYK